MASVRAAVAAAAGASSRRGSALVCPRGGAGGRLALLSSRGGAASPFAGVRGFSTGSSNGNVPFWTWFRARADELFNTVSSAHGVLYIFSTTSAAYAVYYVDGAIGAERRRRERFERTAVKGHQQHVEHTIANIEKLKEKMGHFWGRFLSYREDDLQYRDAVTKSVNLLKSKGYVVLPTAELDLMKSQIAELTVSMEEMNELKEKLASLVHEDFAADPLKDSNEKEGIKEQAAQALKERNEKELDGVLKKVNDKANGEVHTTEGRKTGSSDKMGADGQKTGSGDKTGPL